MSTPEQVVQQRLLLRFGALPDLRIWRQNTGVAWQPISPAARAAFEALKKAHPGGFRPVQYGTPGSADVQGVLAVPTGRTGSGILGQPQPPCVLGRFVAIEVKADGGRLSEDQRRWGAMVESFGGLYVVAKGAAAEDDVARALDAAREG